MSSSRRILLSQRFSLVLALSFTLYVQGQVSKAAGADVVSSKITSAFSPPRGYSVVLVEFEDLECATCAAWNPILIEATTKYHVAWERRDYIIPYHTWSRKAAINARWFDAISAGSGNEYRNLIFRDQGDIGSSEDLQTWTERFAAARGITMPRDLDPRKELQAQVLADCRLGDSLDVHETPTVWLVIAVNGTTSANRVRNRFQLDDELHRLAILGQIR